MSMKVRYTTIGGEVIAENRGGIRRQYIPNPLGSTVGMLDNTQTITDTFQYWPYGEVASRTGTTATPFQYVGTAGYYSDDTNRIYVRARSMSVVVGRWLTVDSYWKTEGMYVYARASPANWADPSGLAITVDPSCSKPPFNAAKILAAANAACKALTAHPPCWGCCISIGNTFSDSIDACFSQFCNGKVVCHTDAQCSAPEPAGCGQRSLCGCTPIGEGPVTLCPNAMNPGCDCLASTIMHELTHACGLHRETAPICVETHCRKGIPGC